MKAYLKKKHLQLCNDCNEYNMICSNKYKRPNDWNSVAQGLILSCSWYKTVTQDTPDLHKNSSGHFGIPPKMERLWRQAINLSPQKWVRVLDSIMPDLPRSIWMPASWNQCQTASTDCHRNQDTLDQILISTNSTDRNVPQLNNAQRVVHTLYSSLLRRHLYIHHFKSRERQ